MRLINVFILIFICFNSFSIGTSTASDTIAANDTILCKNYTGISFSPIQFEDGLVTLNDIWNLQLEYNRNIINFLSIGGYAGVGMFDEWIVEEDEGGVSYTFGRYRYSAHYGLNSKFQILPLLLVTTIPRFNLYVSGSLGVISIYTSPNENILPERGHYFDYSVMGGGSVFITNKLGLFIEAGYRKFRYHNGFNAKYGLTVRF